MTDHHRATARLPRLAVDGRRMPHDRNHRLWDLFHDPAVPLDEFDAARRSWAASQADAATCEGKPARREVREPGPPGTMTPATEVVSNKWAARPSWARRG